MKSGASAGIGSAGQTGEASAIRSCHQWSRPGCILVSLPMRRTTTQFLTVGDLSNAASTLPLSGSGVPRRQPPSAVIVSLAEASLLRSAMASAENPPKITQWTAPIRAQASMAMANSGIIGMYIETTSPRPMPSFFRQLANLQTSSWSIW